MLLRQKRQSRLCTCWFNGLSLRLGEFGGIVDLDWMGRNRAAVSFGMLIDTPGTSFCICIWLVTHCEFVLGWVKWVVYMMMVIGIRKINEGK